MEELIVFATLPRPTSVADEFKSLYHALVSFSAEEDQKDANNPLRINDPLASRAPAITASKPLEPFCINFVPALSQSLARFLDASQV